MNDKELIKLITSKLRCHHLTGKAFEDGCIDGYDVEYVLLAQEILNIVKESQPKDLNT